MKLRHSVSALSLALAVASQPVLAQGHRGGGARGGGGSGHFGGARGGSAVMRPSSPGAHYSAPRMGSAPTRGAYAPRGAYGGAYAPRGAYGTAYSQRGSYGGATARFGGAPVRPGGVAPYRHPRAGTGSGSYYYYGPGRGYGGHHGRYYGGYYRPYYPYYRPYYGYYGGPYVYGSVYLGWPWYSTWPYYSGGYSTSTYTYAPTYYSDDGTYPEDARSGDVAPAPDTRPPDRSAAVVVDGGQVRLEVRPDDASVYVDDDFRGIARDARILDLPAGRHRIELVRPGFPVERREVDVVKGERTDLFVELQRR